MDKLTPKTQTVLLKGSFVPHNVQKVKTAKVEVLPTAGILRKSKPRAEAKTARELAALTVWNKLLSEYNNRSQNQLTITSPEPIGIDGDGRLLMSYETGHEGDRILQTNFDQNFPTTDQLSRKKKLAIRNSFCQHLGKLIKIKELENLVHGDFALRHVLFTPQYNQSKLAVIDVENSQYVNPKQDKDSLLVKEHGKMLGRVFSLVNLINKQDGYKTLSKSGKQLLDKLQEGYNSINIKEPILPDVIKEVESNLNRKVFFDKSPRDTSRRLKRAELEKKINNNP